MNIKTLSTFAKQNGTEHKELKMADILHIDFTSQANAPKFRLIVDAVNNAISQGSLVAGDALPSVNQMCQDYQLSRDTVFKAYSLLKEQGTIESVPNKGYFVTSTINKVFVFLDTFKAYKEVLYDEFVHNLPQNVIADVNFHHYNPIIFKKLIEESIGKYSKYIVMPFDGHGTHEALNLIPKEKLLIIDWKLFDKKESSVLYQDFGEAFRHGLDKVLHRLRKYREIHFLYPEYTNHPYQSVSEFIEFCKRNGLDYVIEQDSSKFDVRAGIAYISVSDRMLGRFLEQCRAKKLEPGIDTGIISYNETPMKKFIYKGITVFSTDFKEMGRKAAEFVSKDGPMRYEVPSEMIIRDSL